MPLSGTDPAHVTTEASGHQDDPVLRVDRTTSPDPVPSRATGTSDDALYPRRSPDHLKETDT
ncbi:MAG: hypothetical protein AVDCRST_MAG70-472 [uncultured Thermomicrobiales bacterium]|uniref:Uncharacterized protein n=1 Tax=uncultured Thermomicrobiales bacterium TaxID=1645740 RepID=A0A6J4UAH4_9BACT|nr:MAG: hypothetical protein AVDCRST_MAG70-472 [uncultured Thermomicrobiales bacterium]